MLSPFYLHTVMEDEMTSIAKLTAASAMALSIAAGGAPAFADPPHCPPGHEMQGRCDNDRRDWDDSRDDRDEARAYRDGYQEGRRDAIRYGDRTYSDYRVISDYSRYNLNAPPNGYYYAQMDDDIVLVMAATQIIQEFIN